MKIPLPLLLGSALAPFGGPLFEIDKISPAEAARLARVPVRTKKYVTAGKTAGIVTLVARRGRVARQGAVSCQDLESTRLP